MNDKIIKSVIFVGICIVVYFLVYNYTTQIDRANKNNTYKSNSEYDNYRIDYVNKYINSLIADNYAESYTMLDDETKASFNNDVNKYSQSISILTSTMNRQKNGVKIDFVNELNMKKYDLIEYNLTSKKYDYIKGNDVYYSDEFQIFKKFYLIEYSPNVFKINFKLY